jgi:cytochrome c oxidase subunit 4
MDASTQKEHHAGLNAYLGVAGLLIILTGITVAVSFVDLGGFNVAVALTVASIKCLLVALVFMHLFYDKKINLIIFIAALAFLTFFLILTLFDTMNRGELNIEKRGQINESSQFYQELENRSAEESEPH